MKTKVKLTDLNRSRIENEEMLAIYGGDSVPGPGSCSCLCNGDIDGESTKGCIKATNTGCGTPPNPK